MRMALVGRYERMSAAAGLRAGHDLADRRPARAAARGGAGAGGEDRQELARGDARRRSARCGARWSTGSPTRAGPARRSWCRCGATPTRPRARSRSRRSASRSGWSWTSREPTVSLAEVLDRREDDDATTVAIYTATEEVTRAELRAQAEALAAVLREARAAPGPGRRRDAAERARHRRRAVRGLVRGRRVRAAQPAPLGRRARARDRRGPAGRDRHPSRRRGARRRRAGRAGARRTAPGRRPVRSTPTRPRRRRASPRSRSRRARPGDPKPVPLVHDNVLGLIDGVLAKLRGGDVERRRAEAGADAQPDPDVAVVVGGHLQRDLRLPRRRRGHHHGALRHAARSPASSSASSSARRCCRPRR